MSWSEAMWNYGIDKPDTRFGMELANFKSAFENYGNDAEAVKIIEASGFKVFNDAETVIGIAVPGAAEYTRKQLDELTEWVKRPQIGMMGLVYIRCNADGTYKSSVDKFFNEEQL